MAFASLLLGLGLLACPATAALRIASDVMTIEHTPGQIAIDQFYNGSAQIVSGGIAALVSQPTRIQLGTNAEIPSLKTYATNKNLRIIYTMTETYYRIVANRRAGIEKLEDLRGKRIATFPTTTAAYFAGKMLAAAGLGEGDYELVSGNTCARQPCGGATMPSQLARGQIDAIALWEPTPQVAVDMLGDDAIVFQDRSLYREVVNLQSTTEALGNPEVRKEIVAFVKAVMRAQKKFNEEPESVYERVAQIIGSDAGVIERAWGIHGWRGALAPDIVEVLIEEENYVAEVQRRKPSSAEEITKLVDFSIMEEVMADLD
jgi:sulfonate transport system substrate-binding protein